MKTVIIDGKRYRVVAGTKWSVTLQNVNDKSDLIVATRTILIENKEESLTIKDKESNGKEEINIR